MSTEKVPRRYVRMLTSGDLLALVIPVVFVQPSFEGHISESRHDIAQSACHNNTQQCPSAINQTKSINTMEYEQKVFPTMSCPYYSLRINPCPATSIYIRFHADV